MESFTKILNSLFAPTNRGILLDVVVFVLNLFLMRMLTANFINLIREAGAGDTLAYYALFLFCLGIFVLPPLGTTLKRWHFHRRRLSGNSVDSEKLTAVCLFNPILYFCLNLIIVAFIVAYVFQIVYGDKELDGATFIPAVLFGIVLAAAQTYIVYRYFTAPTKPPPFALLRDPRAEIFGDACLYLNMILFQLVWNLLMLAGARPLAGVSDFFGRLFFVSFIALLVYFPPRMYYLAEDLKRPETKWMILLANAPVILRVIFGIG